MHSTNSVEIKDKVKTEFLLTLDSITSKEFNISWEAPTGATKYKLCLSSIDEITYDSAQRCNSLIDGYFFDSTTALNMSFSADATGNALEQNTTYYFRVVAYNDSDEVIGVSSLLSGKLASNSVDTNLSKGLVAHYTFDEDDNATIVHDSSGNGNNGVAHGGVQFVDGVIGKAAKFDGVDDYIEVENDNTLNISKDITICSWVNLNQLVGNQDQDIIINKDGDYNIAYELGVHDEPTSNVYDNISKYNLAVYLGDNGLPNHQSGWTDGGIKINQNEWKFICVTYDMNNVKVYENYTLIKQYQANGYINTNNGTVRIGARGNGKEVGSYFNGFIDDLRIYNRALNDSEIKELYKLGNMRNNTTTITQEQYIRDNDKEIVLDNNTTLIWQDNTSVRYQWSDAISYCSNLVLAGYTDWRLPSKNELSTINNGGAEAYFTYFSPYFHWTISTPSDPDASNYGSKAWYIHLGNGVSYYSAKTNNFNVKCVRGYIH